MLTRRIDRIHTEIFVVVEGRRGRIPVDPVLIQVAVVFNVLTLLAEIADLK